MPDELIYYNNEDYLWNMYVENAVELLESSGISNPSEFELWEVINFWDVSHWDTIKEKIEKKFNNITCKQEGSLNKPEGNSISWTDFEEQVINCNLEFAIYKNNDDLLIDTISNWSKDTYILSKS